MKVGKTILKRVEEKVVLAYNAVSSAAAICNDARLKSDLENEKEKLYDILVKCEMIANGDEESTPVESSRKTIKSSLEEELEKQMKERHLKLNPDGDTPDLSAAVEYIEQNDDWYIGTDEQKARKWIRDTLENSDDLITSSMIKDKIQSSAIGGKLRKVDKYSGGIEVDRAFNSDSFADFKRHLAKAVEKANQNGSRMFRDKWEDIVEFTEPELKYLFNGPDGYNLPTSTERTLSPEEKKQRKQWQDDFAYGETVHSIGYNED